LQLLRVLGGALFVFWLLPFAGDVEAFFGLNGWFDNQALSQLDALAVKNGEASLELRYWSVVHLLQYLFGANPVVLTACYWLALAVFALFVLGVASRLTGVLTWVMVVSFAANPALDYEGDVLLSILAFYLMIGHLLLPWKGWKPELHASFLDRSQRTAAQPSVGANLALRLLQVHFAIVVVTSGLHKLQISDWWAGVALWFPLYPPLETTVAQARAHADHPRAYLFVLSLLAYVLLAWQLAFPCFAWRPRARVLLLGGAAVGSCGLAFVYRLPLLGPVFFVSCLSYVTAAEWRRWQGRVQGLIAARVLGPALREDEDRETADQELAQEVEAKS